MENPATAMKANVAIIETNMAMAGITVERMSCKNRYTTSTTNTIASNNETATSWMEA